ncbi:MAG: S-layer homology domain-containing protein [Paenibacillaceae bacterium]
MKRKWTSLAIAITMLVTLLVPMSAYAAGPRIDITSPKANTNDTTGLPDNLNDVPRFTTTPITLTAGIQNIPDSQVTEIYYEITNVKTNPSNNVITVVKSNPAQHVPGSFTITFNNVALTEGLNKIVVKMGTSNAVSSSPSWAYFTPSTNITNLTANGVPFLDTQSYPVNPSTNTTVTISGQAENATSVEVTVGNSTPRSVFLSNGTFFFTADNKTNSTATFHVNSGDNPITIVAKNSTKTYQVQKNLIYDDGNPFAFNASMSTVAITSEEPVNLTGNQSDNLAQLDVAPGSVEVWSQSGRTGIRITDFTVKSDPTSPGHSYLLFASTPPTDPVYVFYSHNSKSLLTTPTTSTTNIGFSANLKVDLTSTGALKYRFIDVLAGGTKFGPYDLAAATAATSAANNGLFPSSIKKGYSDKFVLGIQGTGFNNPGSAINVTLSKKDGTAASAALTAATPATNAAGTMAFFELQSGLISTDGPFKVTISNGATVLNNYTLSIVSAGSLPQVDDASISPLKAGYAASDEIVSLVNYSGIDASSYSLLDVEVTDLFGQSVLRKGTVTSAVVGAATTDFAYKFPAGLAAGLYKLRVTFASNELFQTLITIDKADPVPPKFNTVTQTVYVSKTTDLSSSYFAVSGSNLGGIDDINSAILEGNSSSGGSVNITPYSSDGSTIIFRIDDVRELEDMKIYDLNIDMKGYDNAGLPISIPPFLVQKVVKGLDLTVTPPFPYNDETVTDMWPGDIPKPINPPLLQIDKVNIATTPITIEGIFLDDIVVDKAKMSVQVINIATNAAIPGSSIKSINIIDHTAAVTLPSSLSAGTYFVQVTYASGNVLTRYPITIANPTLASISPTLTYSNLYDAANSKVIVTGAGFGLDYAKLDLQFVSDTTGQITTQELDAYDPLKPLLGLNSQTQATFAAPNLPAGTYTVNLIFNGNESATALKYTVAPPQPALQENALLSVKGRYKVFDFGAGVQIPTDRDQFVQFKFYNFVTDSLQPTTFSYHYVDASLPYVESVMIGNTQQLSELSTNTINEFPAVLNVYTNSQTKKVNLYVGTYTSSSKPFAKALANPDSLSGLNLASIDLDSLPNGTTKFTIVPSNDGDINTPLLGENLSGKRVYDINITSTPYIIVNNVFTGMVVKDPISEITCLTPANLFKAGCISGRLVNMYTPLNEPVDPSSTINKSSVDMYVNGIKTNLAASDIETDGTFYIPFDATHGGPLVEGKNTISFYLYLKGILQTKSTYEIFVFSTTAPEFQTIKPVETTDIPKYIPGTNAGTYATSETAVSFAGQFLNATDFKLTVKSTDANGDQVSLYDRRVMSSSLPDPETNNPGYLDNVNFTVEPLSFTTFPINLAVKGDTIFEFTITNESKVTITKTITITREPLPYVLIYPTLTKNSSGKDQANINSNYVEIEMAAENADSVSFGGKTEAVKRQVTDQYGNLQTHYFYEASNLKAGANNIKFTVVRGTQKTNGTFILFNSNTNIEGAQYKTILKPSMKVFSNEVELKFPAGTNLMRNDASALNQYLTTDRKILFGIASNKDGRVDKYKNPSDEDGQIDNHYPLISPSGKLLLSEPTGRFRPASKMFWIDAGTIPSTVTDTAQALSGSGQLPYDQVDFFSRDVKDLVVPTKRGTLTLKYDPNIRTDAWKYITVYHYDIYEDFTGSVQFRWHNIGGVIDPTKNTITVPFETFGYYQVMYMNQSFDDVTTHPWARNQLDTLYSKGIMVNKDNSEFIPNDNISRGEFSALLVKIFDIPLQYTETPTFADVLRVNPLTNGIYDYRYIETAASAGIVRGSGGGRFSPDDSITRQDAALMISRAANLKLNTSTDKSLTALQKAFTDANGINLYARTAVEAVNKAALIEGKQNVLLQGQKKATFRFDPEQTFTRAEAAEVAIRVLKQQKKIPK